MLIKNGIFIEFSIVRKLLETFSSLAARKKVFEMRLSITVQTNSEHFNQRECGTILFAPKKTDSKPLE